MTRLLAAVCVLAAAVCTKPNPEFCTSSSDCKDPLKPFCDVNGQFGSLSNDCIAAPPVDAAVLTPDGASCAAGAALTCAADTLTSCGSDGISTVQTSCALGCAPGGALRCATFEPSNGLGSALADAGSAADVVIPRGSTIDTDTGVVRDAGSNVVAVATKLVSQTNGPKIRVLLGHSFSIDDVRATGSDALAIVAAGQIHIVGRLDASADGSGSGPGAVSGSAACVGASSVESVCVVDNLGSPCGDGAGGGGNSGPGGSGGGSGEDVGPAGGSTLATTALVGGCPGGLMNDDIFSGDPQVFAGGAGGGAVQIVSAITVTLDASGVIDAGGGGGSGASVGGGAGGLIVVESPTVSVSGVPRVSLLMGAAALHAARAAATVVSRLRPLRRQHAASLRVAKEVRDPSLRNGASTAPLHARSRSTVAAVVQLGRCE